MLDSFLTHFNFRFCVSTILLSVSWGYLYTIKSYKIVAFLALIVGGSVQSEVMKTSTSPISHSIGKICNLFHNKSSNKGGNLKALILKFCLPREVRALWGNFLLNEEKKSMYSFSLSILNNSPTRDLAYPATPVPLCNLRYVYANLHPLIVAENRSFYLFFCSYINSQKRKRSPNNNPQSKPLSQKKKSR